MRKVILYIAMSLDGYIADENGSVGWLSGDGSDNDNMGSYPSFIETVDTVILGYKTYHQIVTELSPDNWAYKGLTSYVLSHKSESTNPEIIFTDENITDLINDIKSKEGKNIWICGGASIANQFLELGLIDKFHITIMPTILGGGTRLFDKHSIENKLKLIKTENYNGIVDLVYEPRKD